MFGRAQGEVLMGELLGALGLAWPRLLFYPGGVFALAASWLLARWLARCAGRPEAGAGALGPGDLLDLLPPLAAVSLLPLAPARGFPYGLDLFVAAGLLEWPRLRRALPEELGRAELLRAYGPVVVAALLMAEGSGGLGLSGLLTWPAGWLDRTLLMGGAGLWLVCLPPVLSGVPGGPAMRARALGLVLVGALPLIGALAALGEELIPGWLAGWVVPPAAMAVAALVVGASARFARAR